MRTLGQQMAPDDPSCSEHHFATWSRVMTVLVPYLVIPFALLVLGGCNGCNPKVESGWEDMTLNEKVWGGYALGKEYRLVVPVFLMGDQTTGYSALIAPSSVRTPLTGETVTPATVDEYRASPAKWPRIAAVVDAGTLVRITHFRLWRTTTNSQLSVFADVASGALQPKDIGIVGLSRRTASDVTLWEPDPAILVATPK